MLRIAAFLCLLFASLSYAQIGPPPGLVGCTTAYVGPGDVQTYIVFQSVIRAYSRLTCGLPVAYVCDSTGGVDVSCDDLVTSTTTGKLVAKAMPAPSVVTCGPGGSTNCTVKIKYNIPVNSTCPVRGANGSPGTCGAVQNTVANRYRIDTSCNTLPPCLFSNAAGAGYTLANSISLVQPFVLYAVAFTANASATNNFLRIGNAFIGYSTGSSGNVLNACDSGTATAANTDLVPVLNSPSDIFETCAGAVGTIYQNGFTAGGNVASGGSTTSMGAPVVMAGGGSPVNFWEFGFLSGTPTPGTIIASHWNACAFYGYTCVVPGPGNIVAFKSYWGLRSYSIATNGSKLINACSAGDAHCQDIVSNVSFGSISIPTIGQTGSGTSNAACSTTITSGTYNTVTGAVALVVDPSTSNPTGLVSTNPFALTALTGTGAFASLNGRWVATAGTNSTTINFTGPTGLGAITITGGVVSTCTIKVFYDLVPGSTFCTVPCDQTQATIANRAVLAVSCAPTNGRPCAAFNTAAATIYNSPGTTSTALPFSQNWVALRSGLFTTAQDVVACNCLTGFFTSANSAFAYDGNSAVASGTAADQTVHSVVAENDVTNTNLYVDGTLAGTIASSGGAMTQPYSIGGRSAGSNLQGNFWEGGIVDGVISSGNAGILSIQQNFYWH